MLAWYKTAWVQSELTFTFLPRQLVWPLDIPGMPHLVSMSGAESHPSWFTANCAGSHFKFQQRSSVWRPSIRGVTGFQPLLGWMTLPFFVKMIDLQTQNPLWCAVVQSEQEEEESSNNKYWDVDGPNQLCSEKIRGETSTVALFQIVCTVSGQWHACFHSWHNRSDAHSAITNKPMCREMLYRLQRPCRVAAWAFPGGFSSSSNTERI